jgi:trk system potassium uptake protein TrkA
VATARGLIERGHEVVIIERDAERIDALREELDCGLIHGAGSRPSVLKEVGPSKADWLLALGDDDPDNIIAALVARELGFGSVITKVEDPQYQNICKHLGLQNTIVPDVEMGRSLADMVEAQDKTSLSTRLKGDLRFLSFTAGEDHAGPVKGLDLPADARVIAITRDDESKLPDDRIEIHAGDEVLLVVRAKRARRLRQQLQKSEQDDGEPGT